MIGFTYCTWWRLPHLRPVIEGLAHEFGTPSFPAHITVRPNLAAPHRCPTPPIGLLSVHEPITTCQFIPSWNRHFHAIECPVDRIAPLPEGAHVSLAYRFDRPFTLDEVGLAYRAIAHVKKIDLRLAEPACYDCRSPLVYNWSEVSLEEEHAQGHGGDC